MRVMQTYIAEDGTCWNSAELCLAHEKELHTKHKWAVTMKFIVTTTIEVIANNEEDACDKARRTNIYAEELDWEESDIDAKIMEE